MRLLVDEHALGLGRSLGRNARALSPTRINTLLPEALEKWTSISSARSSAHLEIVFEINRRFLDEVRAAFPGDDARLARLSLDR
jgi:starch phosphorylase